MNSSNFGKISLLNNLPIEVISENGAKFTFLMPTLKDLYCGRTGFFVTFCNTPAGQLKEKFPQFIIGKSKTKFILQLMQFEDPDNYIVDFLYSLRKFIPNIEVVDDCLKQGRNAVSEQIFNIFCSYFAIATGNKKFEEKTSKKEELTEWEKKRLANKAKVAAIRNKSKTGSSLDMIIPFIAREFHCSFNEIYNMNIYTIYHLYSFANKLMRYDIDVGLAGNGLLKKDAKIEHYTK